MSVHGFTPMFQSLFDRLEKRRLTKSVTSPNGMGQFYTHPKHPVIQRAVALAKETQPKDVLELGSGAGAVTRELFRDGDVPHVVATDLATDQFKPLHQQASDRGWNLETEVINASQPLPEKKKNAFDMVVAKDVLPFLTPEGVNQFLKNIADALKPGGWFLVTAPSTRSELFTSNRPASATDPLYRYLSPGDQKFIGTDRPAFCFESVKTMADQLAKVGLQLTEANHFGRAKGWLMAIGQKPLTSTEIL